MLTATVTDFLRFRRCLLPVLLAGLCSCLCACCSAEQPNFTHYAPIRQVSGLEHIVADIESHLPSNHPYRDNDKITWVHEGTHGINSQLRGLYGKPAFYVLRDRAIVLQKEPQTTLSEVARGIPISLRGDVYVLYLINSQRWWNNEPEYLFDEFVAYTNGSEARRQLAISERSESVRYMLEFCVYSTSVQIHSRNKDESTRNFLKWNIERAMKIYKQSGIRSTYLVKLRTMPDAEILRNYMQVYYGPVWCKKVLGF